MSKEAPHAYDAHLSTMALIAIASLGSGAPEPLTSASKISMTAQVERLGWKILPIPNFWEARRLLRDEAGNGNAAFLDFNHVHEWLIVPPDGSDIRARKVEGKIRAIRVAYDLALHGEPSGKRRAA